MMLDTINTIGQIVPGPIQMRLAPKPVIEPTHNAIARARGDPALQDAKNAASRNSAAVVNATPVLEFSHQPVRDCVYAALRAPASSGTIVSDGVESFMIGTFLPCSITTCIALPQICWSSLAVSLKAR
jgi:hypothetical protein